MFIKIIVSAFIVFALSRVWLRFRDGAIGWSGSIIWSILWMGIGAFTWWPKVSDFIAHKVGIGRGADALVYVSVVALFYAVFRLYIKMEHIEHEITSLVRNLALKSFDDRE